jgi:ribosomal protein S6
MIETTMPATEATLATVHEDERTSYEFAFHVLPTVAEGEVSNVFDSLKNIITKNDGEIFDEEAPERFDLAYEIVQNIEGKNRKFEVAYFGWLRFKMESSNLEATTAEIEAVPEILRYLTVKLTKDDEANPFRFHEAIKDVKIVTTIDPVADEASDDAKIDEVDEVALENALEKDVESK